MHMPKSNKHLSKFHELVTNIKMISTSEIKISCLVDKSDAQKAVKALHTVFNLESDVIADVKGDDAFFHVFLPFDRSTSSIPYFPAAVHNFSEISDFLKDISAFF